MMLFMISGGNVVLSNGTSFLLENLKISQMQTFLPYASFQESLESLDKGRLFKQCVEGNQILTSLLQGGGWKNHPAVKAWKSHELALMLYVSKAIEIAENRGVKPDKTKDNFARLSAGCDFSNPELPSWISREDIHASHRGRLLCKGRIDAICAAICKKRKIRSMTPILKAMGKKEKNYLRAHDIPDLLTLIGEEYVGPNFYDQYGWTEPLDTQYVWP